jgi:hypothetical protein
MHCLTSTRPFGSANFCGYIHATIWLDTLLTESSFVGTTALTFPAYVLIFLRGFFFERKESKKERIS